MSDPASDLLARRSKRVRATAIRALAYPATGAALLFLLNVWTCWRVFRVEYSQHFGSVEGFWVGTARYISAHWNGFSWWPLWHGGMPYQDTYVPLVHLAVAAVAGITGMSAAFAYHYLTGVIYALGPVTVFFMACRLGAPRGAAFVASICYSLFSPAGLLLPEVLRDMGGPFYGRRLQVLTVYGEGPHICALTILPLTIMSLQAALDDRSYRKCALAGLAAALLFLTNVPGTMAFGVAVFCWIVAQPRIRWRAAFVRAMAVAGLAYAISCYGVPPSSLRIMAGNVARMQPGFGLRSHFSLLCFVALLLATGATGFWLGRTRIPLFARFGLLYSGMLAIMIWTARPPLFELLPQVARLHLEMEIGLSLLLGAAAWWLYGVSPRWLMPVGAVALAIGSLIQVHNYHWKVHADLRRIDVTTRSEYTTAKWLDANLHGLRVYADGSDAFWLNVFSDSPQIEGCCDQNHTMQILRVTPYLLSPNVNAALTKASIVYLQALGAQALVTSGPASTEEYKAIQSPDRFAALLPVAGRVNGDVIYKIPQLTPSLAHVLHPSEAVPVRADPTVIKDDEIVRYANAVEDPARPAAAFRWTAPTAVRISADLRKGDLVSVQLPWFDGWKATVNGRPSPVSRDGIGFMLLRPACEGECQVTLRWTGPPDSAVCAWISIASIAMAAFVALRRSPRLP